MTATVDTNNYRDQIIALLVANKLPVEDLPLHLDNFMIELQNDVLAGVCGLEIYGIYGLLRSLAVDVAFRRKGLAAELVAKTEKMAAKDDLQAIYLLTETAREYFSRKGYQVISREEVPPEVQQSSEFKHVCPVSATVMIKILNNL